LCPENRDHLSLLSLENGQVTFHWKDYTDYTDQNRTKTMTLDAVEFMRRFLLHVLPRGFVRIRQFGFLANRTGRLRDSRPLASHGFCGEIGPFCQAQDR
jgi:hypothetical protein